MKTIALTLAMTVLIVAATVFMAGCSEKAETGTKSPEPAVETEIAQKICPVMGDAIDKDIYVDHNGRRVYFCCQMCVGAFNKEPEKYLTKLDEQLKGAGPAEPEQGHGAHEGPEEHKSD